MRLLLLLACSALANPIWDAWNFNTPPGAASYQFLKIETDARITGLAGAGSALPGHGSASPSLNPAAAVLDSFKLTPSHGYPFEETGTMVSGLNWNIPVYGQKILLNYQYLDFGSNIPGYSDTDEFTGDYGAHNYRIGLGWAGQFYGVSMGLVASFVENNIANARYYTGIIDAGVQYMPLKGLWLGAAVNNGPFWVSDPQNPANDPVLPPVTLRAGAAYRYALNPKWAFTALADAKSRNEEKLHFPLGLEAEWNGLLMARMGYPVLLRQGSFSYGAGVRFGFVRFDYGMRMHKTLSAGHFFTLGLKF